MANKNIQIKFDIDNKDLEIASKSVMSVVQQIKFLKKELASGDYSQAQFEVMSKKLGDLEDGFKKTRARSGDFLTSLQLIPGPIGEIASKLNGTIALLKTFSGFKLSDLKFQLGETIDDIKDVGKFIGQATGLTKLWTTTTSTLTNVFKGLGLAQNAAATASKALAGAIAATGVGLLVVGISMLISKITEWTSGTEKAEQAQDALSNSIKRVTKSLEDQQGAIADQTELEAMRAKAAGKSEEYITGIRKKGLEEQIALDKQELGEKGKLNKKLLENELNRDIDEKQRQKNRDEITTERNNIGKRVYQNTIALEKLGIQAQIDANAATKAQGQKGLGDKEKLAEKEKQFQQQKLNDQKSYLDAQIEQEVSLATTSAEKLEALYKKRNQFDLDELSKAAKTAEELKDNKKISGDEYNNIIAGIEAKRQLIADKTKKAIETAVTDDKKVDEDRIKNTEEFNRKVRDLKTNAILNDVEREKQARLDQYNDNLADLEKDVEFIKKSETEKAEIRAALKTKFDIDIDKINTETQNKDYEKEVAAGEKRLRLLELQGQSLIQGTKGYFANRRAILDATEKQELDKLKQELEQNKLTKEEYEKAVTATEAKYVAARKDLKDQELAATGRAISATIDAFAGLTGALAGSLDEEAKTSEKAFEKRKKLQIATAIMSAASGAVQILTQPSTIPSPGDWIVKGINVLALAIATKTNIDKIKATKFEGGGGSVGSGASAPPAPINVVATRASGGIVTGAGTSTSDSINARLSNGEYVVNARATSSFLPLLNTINDAGLQPRFASGGLFTADQGGNFVAENITRAIQDGMDRPVKTYVVGTEMSSQQQFDRTIKSRSII